MLHVQFVFLLIRSISLEAISLSSPFSITRFNFFLFTRSVIYIYIYMLPLSYTFDEKNGVSFTYLVFKKYAFFLYVAFHKLNRYGQKVRLFKNI